MIFTIENWIRIISVGAIIVIIAINLWLRFKKLNDYVVENKEIEGEIEITIDSKIYKRHYERSVLDIISGLLLFSFTIFGLAQPWNWIATKPALGTGLTTFSITAIFSSIIGLYLVVVSHKKKYTRKCVIQPDPEEIHLYIDSLDCFESDRKTLLKADSIKDAMNENFKELINKSEKGKIWKLTKDGVREELIVADDIKHTDDSIEIISFPREGGTMVSEFLDSYSGEEIIIKDTLVDIISNLEDVNVGLLKDKHFMQAQQKVSIQVEVAKKLAIAEQLKLKCEGIIIDDEDIPGIEIIDRKNGRKEESE